MELRVRRLEGWRVGKSEGVKDSERRRVQGFKDSRIQVEKDRGLEGWKRRRVQGVEDSRIQVVCLAFFSKHKSEGAKDFTTRGTRETK